MLSLGAWGILSMILQGMILTAHLVLGKILQDVQWPYFRLNAAGSIMYVLAILSCSWTMGGCVPEKRKIKWVALRGLFGVGNFVLLAVAVRMNVPTGDVAALASINTVMAALMGRFFLGEPLRWPHFMALSCCLGGAVLISKPEFVFGSSQKVSLVSGYLAAIGGGLSMACVPICARKAGDASLSSLTVATGMTSFLATSLLPLTPLMDDCCLQKIGESTLQAFGWMVLFSFNSSSAALLASAASKWCPAAVSATASTASRMVWGYVAQVVFFDAIPDAMSLGGAVLMLVGVIVMAVARVPPRPDELRGSPGSPAAADSLQAVSPAADASGDTGAEDETESLGSFIASEFAQRAAHENPMRLRRLTASIASSQAIGMSILPVPDPL
eukprot:TRINITY_DN25922_c0_g1_i1.p1 TRINITY_DN25922_c0_g1~~TRINITY_DN25922_c0_g1_i1.p1  ORF type:complete len:386 (-),score=50.87 TRINITY_DN25922_c0_g1_i1:353-1510(-)